jgi:hypothetical protein
MLAHQKNHEDHHPLRRRVAFLLLSAAFLWAFLGTIDGPGMNFGIGASSLVYKTSRVLDGDRGVQPGPFAVGPFPEEPLPVHASFLLFDFKQNLRRWPNVAGDISRSPPFFPAA